MLIGMIVRHGATLTAAGLVVGSALSIPAARIIRTMFAGSQPAGFAIYVVAAVPLVVASIVASYLPLGFF